MTPITLQPREYRIELARTAAVIRASYEGSEQWKTDGLDVKKKWAVDEARSLMSACGLEEGEKCEEMNVIGAESSSAYGLECPNFKPCHIHTGPKRCQHPEPVQVVGEKSICGLPSPCSIHTK